MKKILLIVLIAAMVFSVGFSAENSTNGITDDSVKIGSFQALSGALAFIGVSMNKGMEAYFNWVNKNGYRSEKTCGTGQGVFNCWWTRNTRLSCSYGLLKRRRSAFCLPGKRFKFIGYSSKRIHFLRTAKLLH